MNHGTCSICGSFLVNGECMRRAGFVFGNLRRSVQIEKKNNNMNLISFDKYDIFFLSLGGGLKVRTGFRVRPEGQDYREWV